MTRVTRAPSDRKAFQAKSDIKGELVYLEIGVRQATVGLSANLGYQAHQETTVLLAIKVRRVIKESRELMARRAASVPKANKVTAAKLVWPAVKGKTVQRDQKGTQAKMALTDRSARRVSREQTERLESRDPRDREVPTGTTDCQERQAIAVIQVSTARRVIPVCPAFPDRRVTRGQRETAVTTVCPALRASQDLQACRARTVPTARRAIKVRRAIRDQKDTTELRVPKAILVMLARVDQTELLEDRDQPEQRAELEAMAMTVSRACRVT